MIKSFLLGSLLLTSSIYGDGFGFALGPFSLEFRADGGNYVEHATFLDNPFCNAIRNQKRVEIIVEGKETVNPKELKIVTKRLVVEPHAFGINKEGTPILNGNVIEEKQIKEVTVKFEEEQFNVTDKKKGGFFSGWFKSDKNQNVDIRKVKDVHVIEGSHFDAPKNYKGFAKEDNIQVICELPVHSK